MDTDDDLHPVDERRRDYLVQLLTASAFSLAPLSVVQAFWGSTPDKLDKLRYASEIVTIRGERTQDESCRCGFHG